MIDTTNLLTKKQAAAVLKCSVVTLDRWRREGKIKPTRINGRRYFSPDEIQRQIVDDGTSSTPAEVAS